jgi:hypothetical protein
LKVRLKTTPPAPTLPANLPPPPNHTRTWTVEEVGSADIGQFRFKNDSGSYLAMQGGELKKGKGGKWCKFRALYVAMFVRSVSSTQ